MKKDVFFVRLTLKYHIFLINGVFLKSRPTNVYFEEIFAYFHRFRAITRLKISSS